MNKLAWFALGSAVTVVGIGIAALISDGSSGSGGSSEFTNDARHIDDTEHKNATVIGAINNAESTNNPVAMNDNEPKSNNNINGDKDTNNPEPMDIAEQKLNGNADSNPNDGTDLKSNGGPNTMNESDPKE